MAAGTHTADAGGLGVTQRRDAWWVGPLATALGLSKREVSIVSGERSRAKRVRIQGRTATDVERLLKPVR